MREWAVPADHLPFGGTSPRAPHFLSIHTVQRNGAMADAKDIDHVWELMRKIGFCMLSSFDGEEIRSRPMAAYVRPEEGSVYFLTDVESAFADPSANNYVSVSGRASVSNDREKIRELFGTPAKAWWDSPEDPPLRVLKITPVDAQYWDSPGKLRAYVRMALAAVSSARPAMGENEKVDMQAAD
jgi:general stress protein 26